MGGWLLPSGRVVDVLLDEMLESGGGRTCKGSTASWDIAGSELVSAIDLRD